MYSPLFLMANSLQFLNKIEAVDIIQVISGAMSDNEMVIADQQRAQLRAGKNREGNNLIRYRDDDYFPTPAAAIAYEEYKSGISPNPSKPRDVADYFIYGVYHESITVDVAQNFVRYDDHDELGSPISQKEQGLQLGLNIESWTKVFNNHINDSIVQRLRTALSM